MAGEIQLNGTTALTESGGAVTLNNVNSATNRTNLGLGSFVDTSSSQTLTNKTLGSGVVFPAGTVLQTQQYETQETNGLTTSYVNYWENSITLKSNSSDVILLVNFSYYLGTGGFGVQIYRNNSATVTTAHTAVWNKNLEATGAPFTFYGSVRGTGSFYAKDSLSGFSVGDTLHYGLFARKYDSATVDLPAGSTTNGYMSMVLMETQK